MKPFFVRELSDPERQALQAGLRSSDGFTVRRCHILLASARGDTAPVIAQAVGCSPQAVRNVLRAFESRGLAVVALQSRRPHTAAKLFDAERSARLKALLQVSHSMNSSPTWFRGMTGMKKKVNHRRPFFIRRQARGIPGGICGFPQRFVGQKRPGAPPNAVSFRTPGGEVPGGQIPADSGPWEASPCL
jgi:hypothetical protein